MSHHRKEMLKPVKTIGNVAPKITDEVIENLVQEVKNEVVNILIEIIIRDRLNLKTKSVKQKRRRSRKIMNWKKVSDPTLNKLEVIENTEELVKNDCRKRIAKQCKCFFVRNR